MKQLIQMTFRFRGTIHRCLAAKLILVAAIGLLYVPSNVLAQKGSRAAITRYRQLTGRQPRTGIPREIGKNHELVRDAFKGIVRDANKSVVAVLKGDKQVALGAIMAPDGYILSKASECRGDVNCRIPEHGTMKARTVATDRATDLALLKVELSGLKPIVWSKRPAPKIGSWVSISSDRGSDPLVIGVISAWQHHVPRDAGVLGVHIEDSPAGLLVTRVLPGGAAAKAKLRRGDIIQSLDDDSIRTTRDLVKSIQRRRPSAAVNVGVLRDGKSLKLESRLSRATDISGAEQGLLAHEGGPLSERRSDFPRVIEHDCLVMPSQCGGPLVDVYGDTIGLNIARVSRVSSYALPKDVVVDALKRMRK